MVTVIFMSTFQIINFAFLVVDDNKFGSYLTPSYPYINTFDIIVSLLCHDDGR